MFRISGYFFAGSNPGGFLHPRLNLFAIETLIRNLFRLGQVELGEKLVVNVG